jgi:hypothetical protein
MRGAIQRSDRQSSGIVLALLRVGRSSLLLAAVFLGGCGGGAGGSSGVSGSAPTSGQAPHTFNEAGGFNGAVRSLLPVPDGSGDLYISGDFTSFGNQPVARVVRVRSDGTLDPNFVLPAAITGSISSVAVSDDGSGAVYVAEQITGFPLATGRIWKLTPQGAVDPAFTVGNVSLDAQNEPFFGSVTRSLVPVGDGSGRFYAAVSGTYNGVAVGPIIRVNPDGSLDQSFVAQGGIAFRIVPAQDGSGDLYVASWLQHSPSGFAANLARLNFDGSHDAGFQAPGHWPEALWESADVSLMVPVGDGSGDLFVVGFFPNAAAPQPLEGAYRGLVRMNPDGSIDASSPKPQVDPSQQVVALVKATDGTQDWFVGQNLDDSHSRVFRFGPDGMMIVDFIAGQIVANALLSQPRGVPPYLFLPAPDGSGDLFIGGEFSSYNGVPVGNIVRINRDGTRD